VVPVRRWFQGQRFGCRGRVFVIPIALVMVAYIALVWFGGRIPFVPVWLVWLPEWVWQRGP